MALTQIQKLAQQQQHKQEPQPNPSSAVPSWMWNPKFVTAAAEATTDDDSWEVRAFAEDTNNAMGTTWPPRSYTCTFCRREFRSAQALGGHMNVHRRDRARLHQAVPTPGLTNSVSPSPSTLLIPTQEIVSNGGVCLLYSIPNPNDIFCATTTTNGCAEFPSTHLPISPFLSNGDLSTTHPSNLPVAPRSHDLIPGHSSNAEVSPCTSNDYNQEFAIEELDLELRLGCGSNPS